METLDAPARDLGLLSEFIADANSVVFFKLVRSPDDLRNDKIDFNPSFSHQIFGHDEKIYGYKDLKISIYYSAARLNIYVGVEHSTRTPTRSPENILQVIFGKYNTPFISNLDEFEKELDQEKTFKPFGTMMTSFKLNESPRASTYEMYHCTAQTPGWVAYHKQLQTFILWFIDAASYIFVDDNWHFFVLYEKYVSKDTNEHQYAIIGYTTVYEYYAYPANIRPRISQMLILPPFQRKGFGQKMLNAIYQHYSSEKKVLDITVEDPAEDFQSMRDFVDCKNCKKLASFEREKLKAGYTDDMANEARERYKINKKQARRIYEILRLFYTDQDDEQDFTAYRLSVKKRLNALFQRDMCIKKSASGVGGVVSLEPDEKKRKLKVLFDQLLEEYSAVVDKLKTCHDSHNGSS